MIGIIMKTKVVLLASALVVGTTIGVFAHGGATGIVKERMHGMMAMGKAMKSVAEMLKGKTDFNAEQVAAASDIVLQHSANIEKLFPDTKESRTGKATEAVPAIWEDRENFLAIATELQQRAGELKLAAAGDDQAQMQAIFGQMAKTCSACHKDYRQKKK